MNIIFALSGGILIGLSSAAMLYLLGRITGISGFCSAFLQVPTRKEWWKHSFIFGLLAGSLIMILAFRETFFSYQLGAGPVRVLVAGFLVGLGSRIANGCTSGHGVCGVSRLAKRSVIATLIFICSGIFTRAVERFFL